MSGPTTSRECVFCGTTALQGPDGTLIWVATFGETVAVGPHDHETIDGET